MPRNLCTISARPAQRFGSHSRRTHGGGGSTPHARARVKHLDLPNVNIPTHQSTGHNATFCGVSKKYKRSTLHQKIANFNLNSTWHTYPRGPNIWPSSAHSLGLAEERFHVRRVKHIRIYKTVKFHWFRNGPAQNIVNFGPQYLVFQGLPNLASVIFVISSMR